MLFLPTARPMRHEEAQVALKLRPILVKRTCLRLPRLATGFLHHHTNTHNTLLLQPYNVEDGCRQTLQRIVEAGD